MSSDTLSPWRDALHSYEYGRNGVLYTGMYFFRGSAGGKVMTDEVRLARLDST